MGANFMHFDTLAKHTSVNAEKYTALLSVLIKEFENRFQDLKKKKKRFFCIFAISFLADINTLPADFQSKCTELQSDIQI